MGTPTLSRSAFCLNFRTRASLDRVRMWASEAKRPAITLTTFANVPWNAPLYEHLGFVVLSEEEIGLPNFGLSESTNLRMDLIQGPESACARARRTINAS